MSDPQNHPNPPDFLADPPSPEEREAAEAANAADAASAEGAELAALKTKNAELADLYLRAQADVQNARRRADEEISKGRKFAIEAFAESLLPVLDSLEAGLVVKDATPEQIREGAEATLRQLKSALERNKVIEIAPAAASKFDPHQHQAISVVPTPGQAPNTVVSVLQKGYMIADRVLRPALVTVSSPN
ncbi:MAG: nucleotide exchange factor GrpE [Gammaproteobacteria bacterium]|nr:nucleotide exchange factor GrpE [Gammaproteobacteria bacterium]MBU1442587.1 nucleotide exchange factor GrpE [Gammaproteobacteria bacterium]MBU2287426.1 nucleotide exchange factor GrpE [Gammaproteobacteria bacterium]